MASTCIHGYEPGACLICRTLGTGPAAGTAPAGGRSSATATATATEERPRQDADHRGRRRSSRAVPAEVLDAASPRRRGVAGHLALAVVTVVVLALAAFLVAGVVFTILRLLELVIVAAGAGYVGYHLGYRRGSRRR